MSLDLVNFCERCRKYWARDSRQPLVMCAVAHVGGCCHYGWTEVRVEPKRVSPFKGDPHYERGYRAEGDHIAKRLGQL